MIERLASAKTSARIVSLRRVGEQERRLRGVGTDRVGFPFFKRAVQIGAGRVDDTAGAVQFLPATSVGVAGSPTSVAVGDFVAEIAPVTVKGRKGDVVVVVDETPGKCDVSKVPQLKPAFKKDGTVTAGNASGINDAGAAIVADQDEALDAERHEGLSARDAIFQACLLRFRPILMTSMAFILGVMPLAFSHGAGAGARQSLGTTVVFGMLAATMIGIFVIPVFYVVIQRLSERKRPFRNDEA